MPWSVRVTSRALITATLAVGACGKPTGPAGAGGHSRTITVGNNFFYPNPDTVSPGRVTFVWATPSAGHGVDWISAPQAMPEVWKLTEGSLPMTVDSVGTYYYRCPQHPASMNGVLVVVR